MQGFSSKGKMDPIFIIQTFFASILILGIVTGIVGRTGEFVKQETVQVQTERVRNAALSVTSLDEGYIALDMSGYSIRYDSSEENVYIKFRDKAGNASMSLLKGGISNIEGPSDYENITSSESLLIIKDENRGNQEIRFRVVEDIEEFSTYDEPDEPLVD